MSRCGSVHKKFRVISNWTYYKLIPTLPGYTSDAAAELNIESLGDICEVAVALMWIRMDSRAIRSLVLAVLAHEGNIDLHMLTR